VLLNKEADRTISHLPLWFMLHCFVLVSKSMWPIVYSSHEGRSWYTSHRGRLWIAATAKAPDPDEIKDLEQTYKKIYNSKY